LLANDRILLDAPDNDLAVSTGALHLLRTLEADHSAASPLAEHLIPHCGHAMWIDQESGLVENMGCNQGVNWWVTTRDGRVELVIETDRVQIRQNEWAEAVCQFADAVDAFYVASEPKTPENEDEREWFASFRSEWKARRDSSRSAI